MPCFFGYKTRIIFSFQNNPRNLDPSYKMDLDLWDCFRKGKTRIIAKFHMTVQLFVVIQERVKPCLIAE